MKLRCFYCRRIHPPSKLKVALERLLCYDVHKIYARKSGG